MPTERPETTDVANWRARVAHLASPWEWGMPAFAAFVVSVHALSVVIVVRAATGPVSGLSKLLSVAIWGVAVHLLYLRPLLRTIQRRRTGSELTPR